MGANLTKLGRGHYVEEFTNDKGEKRSLSWALMMEHMSGEITEAEFIQGHHVNVSPMFTDLDSENPFEPLAGPEALKKILGKENWPGYERRRAVRGRFAPQDRTRLGYIKDGKATPKSDLPIRVTLVERVEPSAGHMWHQSRDFFEWPDRSAGLFLMEVPATSEIFDAIDAVLARGEKPTITLMTKVEFYRSEVARGLEEPYHPRECFLDHGDNKQATMSLLLLTGIEVSTKTPTPPPEKEAEEPDPWAEQPPDPEAEARKTALALQTAQVQAVNRLAGWVAFAGIALAVLAGAAVLGMMR